MMIAATVSKLPKYIPGNSYISGHLIFTIECLNNLLVATWPVKNRAF